MFQTHKIRENHTNTCANAVNNDNNNNNNNKSSLWNWFSYSNKIVRFIYSCAIMKHYVLHSLCISQQPFGTQQNKSRSGCCGIWATSQCGLCASQCGLCASQCSSCARQCTVLLHLLLSVVLLHTFYDRQSLTSWRGMKGNIMPNLIVKQRRCIPVFYSPFRFSIWLGKYLRTVFCFYFTTAASNLDHVVRVKIECQATRPAV